MSTAPPPMYVPVPHPAQAPLHSQGGSTSTYVPPMYQGYQGMPAQPVAQPVPVSVPVAHMQAPPPPFAPQGQPFTPQGQPMMYAAAPVSGPVSGGVYAQPIYGQPASGEHVVLVNHHEHAPIGMFTDGLFDCFNDASSCLLATFCRPVRWGLSVRRAGMLTLAAGIFFYGLVFWGETVATRLFQLSCWSTAANGNSNDNTCRATTATYVLIVLAIACMVARIVLGTVYRGKIRDQHQIPGSSLEDCCVHVWCGCCAVAQEARHVDRMTGFLPMPHAQAYQQFNH